jgi:metallo-beta-lactamase family protein
MTIQFCGAAQTVTGSKHLITAKDGFQVLLDCGLFQGIDTTDLNLNFPFDAAALDCLVLSHAHIDHTGLVPRLIKLGFTGTIYSTPATKDLCEVMLLDSAYIQQKDLERINKKKKKQGQTLIEELYDAEDVAQAMSLFKTFDYKTPFQINENISVCYYDTAHILGSAAVLLEIKEDQETKKLFFSGDIGRPNDRILRMPDVFPQVDYIISESTYGNRLHEVEPDMRGHLQRVIYETCVEKQGKVFIPAFSVDRTQELVFALDQLYSEGKLPPIKIYVDSKLSVKATQIMAKHEECFNPEILQYIKRDGNAFSFENLVYITEIEDSKKLNDSTEPCVIISSSGMAEAGRIKHHIKNGIGDERNTVLIVGYCSANSLGGALKRGDKEVRIFNETFAVKLQVEVMDSFSAHADYNEMIQYFSCQDASKIKGMYLVHGELEVQVAFREKLVAAGFKNVFIPAMEGIVEV